MELENIRVALRPRNPWEAIDLGFNLVQQHAWPLYRLWISWLAIPLLLLYTLLPVAWVLLVLWIFRPLLDTALVFFFSRSVFGEQPSWRDCIKQLPNWLFSRRLWYGFLWLRLSTERATSLPVWLLEGRQERRSRLRLLGRGYAGKSTYLTFLCSSIEWVLYCSSFFLLWLFIPEPYMGAVGDYLWDALSGESDNFWFNVLVDVFGVLCFAIVEPFFIASGFALYINRRSELEAWDLELKFRKMAADA